MAGAGTSDQCVADGVVVTGFGTSDQAAVVVLEVGATGVDELTSSQCAADVVEVSATGVVEQVVLTSTSDQCVSAEVGATLELVTSCHVTGAGAAEVVVVSATGAGCQLWPPP